MATANVRNILRSPGSLCINPTDLTTAFPHGGTAIGVVRDLAFVFNMKTSETTGEEWGGVATRVFYDGEKPFIAAVLREFDDDAISNIFPNTAEGTVSQTRQINMVANSGNRAGFDLTGQSFILVFSPDDVDRKNFILLHRAVPAVEETSRLNLKLSEEVGLGVVFWATPDADNEVYRIGKRADLNPDL